MIPGLKWFLKQSLLVVICHMFSSPLSKISMPVFSPFIITPTPIKAARTSVKKTKINLNMKRAHKRENPHALKCETS